MIKQYPYRLQRYSLPPSSRDDSTGIYTPGSPSWVDVCNCRDEDAKQRRIITDDGSYMVASFLVQCPIGTVPPSKGEKIQVLDADNQIRVDGKVLYSEKGQLHTRIWV